MALDFSNQDLRGKSFKNQDLSGANFSNAKCGQRKLLKPLALYTIYSGVGIVFGGLILAFSLIYPYFSREILYTTPATSIFLWLMEATLINGIVLFIGMTMIKKEEDEVDKMFSMLLIPIVIPLLVVTINILLILFVFMFNILLGILEVGINAGINIFITLSIENFIKKTLNTLMNYSDFLKERLMLVLFFITTSIIWIIAIVVTVIAGGIIISALIMQGITPIALLVSIIAIIIVAGYFLYFNLFLSAVEAIFSVPFFCILVGYMGWCISYTNTKYTYLRELSLILATINGTVFENVNLANTNFNLADLKLSVFHNAIILRTNWRDCKNLKFAYLKGTILEIPIVRNLLVSGNGQNQSFVGLNLTGAYLKDANLENADFTDANLMNVDLRNANLRGAKLSRANLLQADLSGANLTGAYLENWNIDDSTILENAEADYVYLPERQPPEGNFKKDEFSKLFQQVTKTLDFIVENRLELEALLRAAQKLKEQVPDLELQGIERKQESAVIKFTAPPEFDREQLFAEINRQKEQEIKLLTEITGYKRELSNLSRMFELALGRPFNINVENKAMTDNRNLNISGSTLTGNTLNLGEISGQVQNSIQQIPVTNPEQNQLKETLSKLQQWIEKLPEKAAQPEDKADVLQHIEKIAEVSQQPKDQQDQGVIRTALKVFKGFKSDVDETISDSKNLLKEFDDLVAHIKSLFP